MKFTKTIIASLLVMMVSSCYGQETKRFKARNGVSFDYEVIFPEGYNKSKDYELAMVFSEIEAKNGGYAPTLSGVKESKGLKNTICFVPKVPVGKPHWISHPIHHGLDDFMRNMRSEYGKEGQQFHFIGHLLGGRVAQTYSGMSSQYIASVSFAHSTHWDITKQEYFDEIFKKGFKIYVFDTKDSKNISLDVSKATFNSADSFSSALLEIDQKIKSM